MRHPTAGTVSHPGIVFTAPARESVNKSGARSDRVCRINAACLWFQKTRYPVAKMRVIGNHSQLLPEEEVLGREGGPGLRAGPREPHEIDPERNTHAAQVTQRLDNFHNGCVRRLLASLPHYRPPVTSRVRRESGDKALPDAVVAEAARRPIPQTLSGCSPTGRLDTAGGGRGSIAARNIRRRESPIVPSATYHQDTQEATSPIADRPPLAVPPGS